MITVSGATVSGRIDLVATRDQELVIIDAKAARPSEVHSAQVMLYKLFLQFQSVRTQGMTVTGDVYYGEDHIVPITAGATDQELRNTVEGLNLPINRQGPAR